MKRRNFINTLSTFAVISAVSPLKVFSRNETRKTIYSKELIKPKRLLPGNTIGLIAPGSFITEDELKESIQNLESLGFKVKYTNRILARYGYLAGSDKQRAADVNEMFSRNDIDAVVAARGGYGCTRILPLLDYKTIKKNPKILLGYSDVTALLYGVFKETGLICFHGPVGISTFNKFSVDHLKYVLEYPQGSYTMYNANEEDNPDNAFNPVTIRNGTVRGKLIGGNLSLIVSLIGTPYDIDMKNEIIFIEEIDEEPYRIDRMLTQMIEAGKFEKAAGIALGVFLNCKPKGNDADDSFSLLEVLFDRLFDLNIPVAYGMSFGHINDKFTLPFGINAEFNSLEQTLTLLEPAVL